MHRAHKGRLELETARGVRWPWGDAHLILLLSEGQMSDYKGAALMLAALPKAKELLGDKGYDADWFRKALAERGITACIPSKCRRGKQYAARHGSVNVLSGAPTATVTSASTRAAARLAIRS